jgi:hypothetical protein
MADKCPKCESVNIYREENMQMACKMCGKRWPFNGVQQVIITKLSEEDEQMALDKELLIKLHGEGKSDKEIATALNAKDGTVWAARTALGLKANYTKPQFKNRKLSPDKIKEIKTHVKALGIKRNGGDPNTAGIVASIDMQIEHYQAMIGKLKQAKEILL